MSNAPDRPAVVRQDLDNVIHPIVPHKQLEQQQLVIVSGKTPPWWTPTAASTSTAWPGSGA
jgi:hypothetical protein